MSNKKTETNSKPRYQSSASNKCLEQIFCLDRVILCDFNCFVTVDDESLVDFRVSFVSSKLKSLRFDFATAYHTLVHNISIEHRMQTVKSANILWNILIRQIQAPF